MANKMKTKKCSVIFEHKFIERERLNLIEKSIKKYLNTYV